MDVYRKEPSDVEMRKNEDRVEDRRTERSADQYKAVVLQLEYVKERLTIDALVLSDDLGEVVAAVGKTDLVENLADQAPWLLATPSGEMGSAVSYLWNSFPGIKPDQVALREVPVNWKDGTLILSGIGDSQSIDPCVEHVSAGLHRIIGSELEA